jgi:hypothetical protein
MVSVVAHFFAYVKRILVPVGHWRNMNIPADCCLIFASTTSGWRHLLDTSEINGRFILFENEVNDEELWARDALVWVQ